ncbi:MAG: WXG100 family type VII secretion target [Catenulispora sp.]
MPIDWDHEVYNSGDNIPGDPGQVAALGKQYRDTADAIRAQAANIRNLVNGQGWDSDSGREFQKSAGDTADKLEKAFSRYDAAAGALGTTVAYPPSTGTWAESLAYAQELAKDAIRRGQEAQHQSKTAQGQIDSHHQQQANQPPPPAGVAPAGPDPVLTKLNNQKAGHDADMAQAEKDLQHARDLRNQQANKFADAIVSAYNHDGLKDGFWDKVGDIINDIEDIAQVVGHWAGLAASILGVLALAFSWVPVLGEVLGALAAIASVVALACDLVNALDGRGTWLDVGIDILGVVSCGSGRLLGNLAKGEKFFSVLNGLKGTRGMSKALRFAKAGDAASITGGKAAKLATAKGYIAALPESGVGRYWAMARTGVKPSAYWNGMKEGADTFGKLGFKGALKDGIAKYPTSLMTGGGKLRYFAWSTVPVTMGYANLGEAPGDKGESWTTTSTWDKLDWAKHHIPVVGANGVGGDFKWKVPEA